MIAILAMFYGLQVGDTWVKSYCEIMEKSRGVMFANFIGGSMVIRGQGKMRVSFSPKFSGNTLFWTPMSRYKVT